MNTHDRISRLRDRLWCADERVEIEALLDELAEIVLAGFKRRNRHMLALSESASWYAGGPLKVLRRHARCAVFLCLERDISPERFLSEARAHLARSLEPPTRSRRRDDDPRYHVALEDVVSSDPTPEDKLIASESQGAAAGLVSEMLDHSGLTATERRVAAARLELGPGASGRDIAELARVSPAVERTLTRRLRRKIAARVHKIGRSMTYQVGDGTEAPARNRTECDGGGDRGMKSLEPRLSETGRQPHFHRYVPD